MLLCHPWHFGCFYFKPTCYSPFYDSSLNSSRRPREEANRRPHQRNQYSIIINIIIVHLFFCGLSVDLVGPADQTIIFSPSLPSQQLSHFHPHWWIGWLCVSLCSHSLFSSLLLSSPLLDSVPPTPQPLIVFHDNLSPPFGTKGEVCGYLFQFKK